MEQTMLGKNEEFNNHVNIRNTDVVYICGKRSCGKSYLLARLLEKYENYILYDGATHQHSGEGFIVRTPEELLNAIKSGTQQIVCQPLKDGQDIFNEFCKIIWEEGNYTLAVEELGNYCDSYSASEFFDIIARVGRNRGIGIIAINQRPARIWNNFIALIDHWCIFSIDLPKDLKFLSEYIGDSRAQSLKNLPKRYFYYKNSEETILCNPLK